MPLPLARWQCGPSGPGLYAAEERQLPDNPAIVLRI